MGSIFQKDLLQKNFPFFIPKGLKKKKKKKEAERGRRKSRRRRKGSSDLFFSASLLFFFILNDYITERIRVVRVKG